jgi:competence protein ComEC
MPQFALAILFGALLAFFGNQPLDIFWSAYLPLCLLFARYCPRYRFLCLLTASLLWSNAVIHQQLAHRLSAGFDDRGVLLSARIADLPRVAADRVSLLLDDVHIDAYPAPLPRRLRLNWYQGAQVPRSGERWQFMVRLRQPRGRLNSAGFDYEAWQFLQGIDASGYVVTSAHNRRLAAASSPSLQGLRARLASNIEHACAGCRHVGLIKALALGYRGDIDPRARDLLQASGTAHLLAISGLHVGMVAMLFYALGHWLWRAFAYRFAINRHELAALSAFLAAFAYAALAGFSLPTLRALIMLGVVLLGQQFNQQINLLQSLLLALILILLTDPLAVGSASFWLSFGALSIIAFAQFRMPRGFGGWRQLVILQCCFVVLLAPLGALIFGQLNVAGLPANLLAIPALSLLILPLVLGACLLSLVAPGAAGLLFGLADRLLGYLIDYLDILLSLGLHARSVAAYPAVLVILALVAVVLLLLPALPGRYRIALAILTSLVCWQPPRLAPGEYELRVLDVGMGSSMLLRTRHHSLVYDFGPGRNARYSAADMALLPVMRQLGIERADLLIASHVDQDHSGGLYSFIGDYQPAQLLSGTPVELRNRYALPHRVRSCHAYPDWRWDGVVFRFLDIDQGVRGTNNHSCVLQVIGHHRLLIPGDIESAQEHRLIESYGDLLAADILLAPHHGSNSSSSQAFIERVNPRLAVFTLARNNRWGFPTAAVQARYRARDVALYRNDRHGAVRILSQARRLRVTTMREPPRRLWRRW